MIEPVEVAIEQDRPSLQLIMTGLMSPALVVNLSGRIVLANADATRMLIHTTPQDILANQMEDPRDRDLVARRVGNAVRSGERTPENAVCVDITPHDERLACRGYLFRMSGMLHMLIILGPTGQKPGTVIWHDRHEEWPGEQL